MDANQKVLLDAGLDSYNYSNTVITIVNYYYVSRAARPLGLYTKQLTIQYINDNKRPMIKVDE